MVAAISPSLLKLSVIGKAFLGQHPSHWMQMVWPLLWALCLAAGGIPPWAWIGLLLLSVIGGRLLVMLVTLRQ